MAKPKALASLGLATVQVFGLITASNSQQPADPLNSGSKEIIIQRSPNLDTPCSISDPVKDALPSATVSNQAMLTAIADQLCKANLLTNKAYQAAKTAIKKGEFSTRSELLGLVGKDAFLKQLGFDYTSGSIVDGYGDILVQFEVKGDQNEQKIAAQKLATEQQKRLDQLQATGILSDRAYNLLKTEIAADKFQLGFELFNRAALEMSIDDELQSAQSDQLLNDLQTLGLLSASQRQQINQAVAEGEIANSIEILNYIDRATIIDLKKLSPDVNQYFLESYQAIASLLKRNQIADITLANFKVDIVQDQDAELIQAIFEEAAKTRQDVTPYVSYQAIVTTTDRNRTYQQAGFYAKPDTPEDFLGRLDGEQAIHLFNKLLRDRQSAYRLYLIQATSSEFGPKGSDYSRFGVIALTESQAKVIGTNAEMLKLSEQSYDNSLTSKQIDQWLELFQRTGLLSHLTPAQIATSRQSIDQSHIHLPGELLAAFDQILVTFNWESGNIDNPYQALTEKFSAASRGAFAPTQITNEFDMDQGKAGQSFIWQGKQYKIKLKFNDDWLDPKFFDFIETVFAETVPEGKLYSISVIGGEGAYIFLTDAQHQALVSAGVLE